ncbi:hypothetical protein ATANTOWER_018084 [Ataeniobius toweri]|uniref:Uncharacterized protein n=1 Tax=Ataeniobius toweri TaxID=208326 RepID=A0ABU7C872_9TELE|nr:hypothetical protein [Ataeniobius toweri]
MSTLQSHTPLPGEMIKREAQPQHYYLLSAPVSMALLTSFEKNLLHQEHALIRKNRTLGQPHFTILCFNKSVKPKTPPP